MRLALLPMLLALATVGASCHGGHVATPPPETPPTVLAIYPGGNAGFPNSHVEFSAKTDKSATSWDWNFGAAAVPDNPANPTPVVTLGTETGDFSGSVTVCDAAGCSTHPFNFRINPHLQPTHYALAALPDVEYTDPSVVLLTDGSPAISRADKDGGLSFFTSSAAVPLDVAAWTEIPIVPPLEGHPIIAHQVLLLRLGRPVILAASGYFESSIAKPTSASDWTFTAEQTPAFDGATIYHDQFALVSNPLNGSPYSLHVYLASSTHPGASTDWTEFSLPDVGFGPVIAAIGNTLYVSVGGSPIGVDDSDLILAFTSDPALTESSWQLQRIPLHQPDVEPIGLELWSGRLRLWYLSQTGTENSGGFSMTDSVGRLLSTEDHPPLTVGEWESRLAFSTATFSPFGDRDHYAEFSTEGFPVILWRGRYYPPNSSETALHLGWSTDPVPSDWDADEAITNAVFGIPLASASGNPGFLCTSGFPFGPLGIVVYH